MIDTRMIDNPPWYATTRQIIVREHDQHTAMFGYETDNKITSKRIAVHVLIHYNIRFKYILFVSSFMLYLLLNPSIMKEEVFLTQNENITKWRLLAVDHMIEWSADFVLRHNLSELI